MRRKILIFILMTCLLEWPVLKVMAHPGETDSFGCHVCQEKCSCWSDATQGELHCHEFKGKVHLAPTVHSTYQCGGSSTSSSHHHYHSGYYSSVYYGSHGNTNAGAALAATAILLGAIVLGGAVYSAATKDKRKYTKYRSRFVGLYTHNLHEEKFPYTQEGIYEVKKDRCDFSFRKAELVSMPTYEQRLQEIGVQNLKKSRYLKDQRALGDFLKAGREKPIWDVIEETKNNLYYLSNPEEPYSIYQVLQMMKDGTILAKPPFENKVDQFCYGTLRKRGKKNQDFRGLSLFCNRYHVTKRKVVSCRIDLELQNSSL